MLKVTPVNWDEIENLNLIINEWGIKYELPPYSLVLKAVESDKVLALGILKFHDSFAEIEKILLGKKDDFEMEFVLGSGLLNFIDRRDFKEVYSTDEENEKLLSFLKFKTVKDFPDIYNCKNPVYHLNLDGYFKAGKCKH